jgi:hypothetical protein
LEQTAPFFGVAADACNVEDKINDAEVSTARATTFQGRIWIPLSRTRIIFSETKAGFSSFEQTKSGIS